MFFIAELGSNWYPDLGFELIEEVKRTGVNCVKFQMWRAEDVGLPKEYELSFDRARKYKEYCDEIGMVFLCTPFYPEAVDFLEELRVPMYKIASQTAKQDSHNSRLIMHRIADTLKPVIISTGMGEPQSFKNILKQNETFHLNCISKYPAEITDYKHGYHEGISDHTLGLTMLLKYGYIYKVIEKHVKLPESTGPDASYSITTAELKDFMILSKSFPLKFG